MRTKIRRDRSTTYNGQMADREMDAERSRSHPNSVANDERQRAASAEARAVRPSRARGKRSVRRERDWAGATDAQIRALSYSGFRIRSDSRGIRMFVS